MYTQYSKPPIEEPKQSKKSKKKNTNSTKTVYLDPSIEPRDYIINNRPFYNDSGSKENSSTTKSLTFSDDDYINDLSEYQEEILNTAFLEENPEFQFELSNTCNDLFEFFKEKNLSSEGEYDNMLKICQDNAKWFMPIQAA